MKKSFYMIMTLAIVIFASCSSDDNDPISNSNNNNEYTIVAKLPQTGTTRIAGSDDTEEGVYAMSFTWTTDQARFVFNATDNSFKKNSIDPSISADEKTATFSLKNHPKANSYIYGCTSTSTPFIGTCKVTNTEETYDAATVNFYVQLGSCISNSDTEIGTLNPMFGVMQENSTDTSIPNTMTFKNVCALIKFTIQMPEGIERPIRYVTIKGWDGSSEQNIEIKKNLEGTGSNSTYAFQDTDYDDSYRNESGEIAVTGKTWYVDGDNKLTLYAVLIPQTLDGLYIQLKLNDGKTTYTKKITFKENSVKTAKTFEEGNMYGINLTYTSADPAD